MNILVITRGAWNTSNNTGNTLENFFQGLSEYSFYNLALKEEPMNSVVCKRSFVISEEKMIKHFCCKKYEQEMSCNTQLSSGGNRIYVDVNKRHNSLVLKIIREIIWAVKRWDGKPLKQYLDEIKPDVVFMPVYNCLYPFDVLEFVRTYTGAKVVLFHADDNLSVPKDSKSDLFVAYRKRLQKKIKKAANHSFVNLAISPLMAKEYSKQLNKEMWVVQKSYLPEQVIETAFDYASIVDSETVKMVYTGNVGSGRLATLIKVGQEINKLSCCKKIVLEIYTNTALSEEDCMNIETTNVIKIIPPVSYEEIQKVQAKADFLVYAEPYDKENLERVRLSFSTKITDYLTKGKCIIAFGNEGANSIQYLQENNAAVVVTNPDKIGQTVCNIIFDPKFCTKTADNAVKCAKKNHSPDSLRNLLKSVFEEINDESCTD
ncbi:glycosyltransferase family 1 protein [Heliophilum fasciatum]|uniref:Glycosyltransferase involved in cell wall biosynthesis n=1 Tax=Heliophilum fasciatum TaxID=35700 RepID=A0A4R2RJY0_9FIRM|nr:glycosyltransferase family 1 protein [Heliophilum fasciatum]MCW2278078.1 glycosyltransferase involved in cell wall biosynthesis [Heliophilum fasciatum]TCP64150.1 hypothetical protein EDD73_1112 [Heliophilum fasciatum]